MTAHYWRITFSRAGETPATYEVVGDTFDEAYAAARHAHCNGKLWSGNVEYVYIGTEPTVRDLSFSMDDLADSDLPF